MRFRAPANVQLRRAQVVLILATLVPTILTTPIGVVLLASGGTSAINLVSGILVLAFGAASVTGYILGSIFLHRGARLVQVQNEFLSSVSHELRTPMTSMRMFVEALLDDRLSDPDERARCLRTVHQEIVRLDGLVGKLIDLNRLESGGQLVERSVVQLSEVVDDALATFAAIRFPSEAHLELEVAPGLRVLGDRAALTQVLVNLLSNAWKHGGADCHIRLKVAAHRASEVVLAVEDDGPGIPSDEHKRIFEKFERGRDALQHGIDGSGLGLSIARALVAAHRGRIEVRSVSGKGASFRVFLPREAA